MHGWKIAMLATLAGACTIEGPIEQETPRELDPLPIIGGTLATEYPESALIDMSRPGQNAICSGAVIAPKVVLTAGHCVAGWTGWRVTVPFASNQSATGEGVVFDYTSTDGNVNPNQHDVGLVLLDSEILLERYPTIKATPVNDGTELVNIGRLQDGHASNSALFVSPPIAVRDASSIGHPFAYTSDQVIQPGDSGGPDMLVGTHTIVAVNSGAGSGIQILARADLVYDWIQQHIDQAPPPGEEAPPPEPPAEEPPTEEPPSETPPGAACGDITSDGACVGATMSWCVNGELMEIDCGSWGLGCQSSSSGALTCG